MRQGISITVELSAIDGFAAHAVAVGEITALDHELRNNAVERGAFVVKFLAALSDALLASAQSTEVFGSLGDSLTEKTHQDTTSRLATDLHIEVNLAGDGLQIVGKGNRREQHAQ